MEIATRTLSRAASLALAAILIAGCGGSGDPAAVVRQAVETRGPARCDLYTDSFFERQAGTSAAAGRRYCRQVASALPSPRVMILNTRQTGDTATVTASASGTTITYRLVHRGGRWLIDALSAFSSEGLSR